VRGRTSAPWVGRATGALRPSLSSRQVRDPLGTLAEAYGVQRDFYQVGHAIRDKCFPDWPPHGGVDREGSAVGQVVGLLIQDGRLLARLYRDSPLRKHQQKFVAGTTDSWRPDLPSGEVAERVYSEIRWSLTRLDQTTPSAGEQNGST
jgi:hypothetical protein